MFIDDFVYFIHTTHGPTQGDDDLLAVRNASIGFNLSRSFGVLLPSTLYVLVEPPELLP